MVQLFALGFEIHENVTVMELMQRRNLVNRNTRHRGLIIVEHIVCQAGVPVTRNQYRDSLAHVPEQIQRLDIHIMAWLRHAFF